MFSIEDFREHGQHHEEMVCIPISSGLSLCLWHRKKTQILTGRAWLGRSWGVCCWQQTQLRKITCGKPFIFFFKFLFLHHYSKLNKKGRAMRKGSYWDPPASPHELVTSLKIVVSRLEHLSLSLFTWHYQPPLQRWFMQQVGRWKVVWRR